VEIIGPKETIGPKENEKDIQSEEPPKANRKNGYHDVENVNL
jgi:hypothetical protein